MHANFKKYHRGRQWLAAAAAEVVCHRLVVPNFESVIVTRVGPAQVTAQQPFTTQRVQLYPTTALSAEVFLISPPAAVKQLLPQQLRSTAKLNPQLKRRHSLVKHAAGWVNRVTTSG
jgi:hypothetical protein